MHRIQSWVGLNVAKAVGMHAVGPEDALFMRNMDGETLCGVNSTNNRGQEIH